LLSFWDTTAILHLEPDAAPVAVSEQVSSVSTLAAGLVGGILAQVTPYSVQLWSDLVAGVSVGTYRATEAEIVAASVKGSHIVAALRDGSVVVWKAGGSLEQLSAFKLAREAVTVDISADGALIAVSDWSGSVQLFDAAGVAVYTTTEQAYAASLLFMPGQLLAGLSDGTCVTYDLGTKARTQSSLGSRPLNLVPVEVACSDEVVFAAGISERLSLVFESRGHTEVSASGKKGVVAAASVSTEALGSCLVLATSQGLCFSRLTSLKTLHVQTLDLGSKSATRVATVPDMKLLAVGTVTQTLAQDTGDVLQVSGVEIRDSTTLKREFTDRCGN
jgi:DNA damage-binding protein 1